MALQDRLSHAWNAFIGRDPTEDLRDIGSGSFNRPDRVFMPLGAEKTIISSIYNKISIDVAAVSVKHVRVDENERYKETIKDSLNECLTLSANKDQTARAFMQDYVLSLFTEGVVAIVPVDTTVDPNDNYSFDIESWRTGKIIQWYPDYVKIELYNDRTGLRQTITMDKQAVAIIENPFYAVMNAPNSTLKRLQRKLALLDLVDEQSSAGKLDLIIQLPYVIKSEARKKQADARRKEIERQLAGSKYGIAYTDGTEHITQLNRSLENNLLHQVEFLTSTLYSQLGLTQAVFDGTADEKVMLNYYNSTIEPLLSAFVDELKRKFLTKTARTQGQSIMFFKDSFKLVPVDKIADIADKFTRNEILSSNEMRAIVGYKPVDDPRADELRNKNLNQSNEDVDPMSTQEEEQDEYEDYNY